MISSLYLVYQKTLKTFPTKLAIFILLLGSGRGVGAESTLKVPIDSPVKARSQVANSLPTKGLEGGKLDAVIVTGVNAGQRQFDASFAVSSLSFEGIQKLAPLNLADLLGQIPGIYAESTGGEVRNVIRLRGIPNEGSFQAFQEDSMPIYPDEGWFFGGESLIRPDIMTRSIDFVRGGPSPIYASNAAAIYNNLTRQGSEVSEGAAQVTVGDTNLYRLDAYSSGKLTDKTYYAVGGFGRRNDGARDNGFPADSGGQIRFNLRREIEQGEVRLFVKVLDDHNVFYLPIPVADPRSPSKSLNPYLNYFKGTMNTPALQNALMLYLNEAGQTMTEVRDLSNGRHLKVLYTGLDFERSFERLKVTNKTRLTTIANNFDAVYSTSNPADSITFAAGYLATARTAFGTSANPVTRMGYAIAGTGGAIVYNPAETSGLVIQGQYRAIKVDSDAVQNETRLTHDFNLAGKHSLVAGLYLTEYKTTQRTRYQDYLFELASKPRTLDLLAYSAAGQVVGSVTDRGVLRYSTTLFGGKSSFRQNSFFLADTWKPTSQLTFDYGLRSERYNATGYYLTTRAGSNLNLNGTLAGTSTLSYTGLTVPTVYRESVNPWTVGANYDLNRQLGFYSRASKSYRVGTESNLFLNSTATTSVASQYEVGAKFNTRQLSIFMTAFYTKFTPFVQGFGAVNPVTGATQNLNFTGKSTSPGVEADISWKPNALFSIDSAVTYGDAKAGSFFNSLGADAAAAEGKMPVRQPKLYGNIRPSILFTVDRWSLIGDVRYNFVSDRYVDIKNTTLLPAFQTYSSSLTAERGAWRFQLIVDNLTNAEGLTEGNPRTDVISGQGSSTAIYGRPLFGRAFRLISSYRW